MQAPPDEATLVGPSTDKVAATFREAGEAFNPQMGIHTARMMYDYCAGLSWPASDAWHPGRRLCRGHPQPVPRHVQGWPVCGPAPHEQRVDHNEHHGHV